jgi:hypothetical protein
MHPHRIDARYWLPALALLPAVPLAFFLWEECCRASRRRSGSISAASAAENGVSEALLPADSGSGSIVSGGSEDAGGEETDVFFSDDARTNAGSSAPPSVISEDQSDWWQHGAEAPDASLFRGWPDAPGLLRLKPGLGQRLTDGADPQRIPLNTSRPIQFETDSFVGTAAIWVRDLPTAPADMWKGKRRRSRIAIQGRFKERICMEDVITGQEFSRATNMPARWLVDQVLVKVARAINPSVEIGAMSAPSVLVPVVAMAQAFAVSEPGEQPDVCGEEVEDARAVGPQLRDAAGEPVSVDKRKAHFSSAAARRSAYFETDKVYTFWIYQHLVNLGTYELDLSVYRFDLAHYLDGQPMQFMMRPRGDKARPYFAFEMWHQKLLAAAQRHHS